MKINVSKGFYVHYKGGIYFVAGIARNFDEGGDVLVAYESVKGCGDSLYYRDDSHETKHHGASPDYVQGMSYRAVIEFVEGVNAYDGSIPTSSTPLVVPRFQRVVGWVGGIPMVLVDGEPVPFVTKYHPQSPRVE